MRNGLSPFPLLGKCETMNEQRRQTRRRALIGARLVIGKICTLDCVVRDISGAGAKLVFATPTVTPGAGFTQSPRQLER